MIYWGILSIFFVFFLPGMAMLGLCKQRFDLPRLVILSIPLSLVFNHYWVWAAAAAGVFSRPLMLSIFVLSAAGAIYSVWKSKDTSCDYDLTGPWTLLEAAALVVGIFALFYAVSRYVASFGTVLDVWDAIVSWNRWAVDWYHSGIPWQTWDYPQLLPITYALTYKMIGTEKVQFFAKTAAVVFEVLGVMAFFDLGLRDRAWRIPAFIGGLVFLYLSRHLAFPLNAYADAPLAALCVFPLYGFCVITAKNKGDMRMIRLMAVWTVVAAAVCTLMKPLGAFTLIYALAAVWIARQFKTLILWAVLALPWYIYKHFQFAHTSGDTSNFTAIFNMIRVSMLEKLWRAVKLLSGLMRFGGLKPGLTLGIAHGIFGAFSLAGALRLPVFRVAGAVTGAATLAIFLVWVQTCSYDTRNLAPALPGFAFLIGGGLAFVSSKIHFLSRKDLRWLPVFTGWMQLLNKGRTVVMLILVVILVGCVFRMSSYNDQLLLDQQYKLQRQIGEADTNAALYKFHSEHGIRGKVWTSYQLFAYLPDLAEYYQAESCNEAFVPRPNDPLPVYVLARQDCSPQYLSFLNAYVKAGKARFWFDAESYRFYEILSW